MNEEIYKKLDRFLRLRPTYSVPAPDINGEYHYTYCRINISNNKFYIGKHSSTVPFDKNYTSPGSKALQNSITKYGIDNFFTFIIDYHRNSDEAYFAEWLLLDINLVSSKDSYNWKGGGWGFPTGTANPLHNLNKQGLNPSVIRSKAGNHHWSGQTNPTIKRLLSGTNTKAIDAKNGIHNWQLANPWNHGNKTSLTSLAWFLADEIKLVADSNLELKAWALGTLCNKELKIKSRFGVEFKENNLSRVLHKIRNNWSPSTDIEWINYKNSYEKDKLCA